MNEIKKFGKKTVTQIKKHEPEIWAGLGIGGFVATVYLAVKATPKAAEKIKQAEFEKNASILTLEDAKARPSFTAKEIVIDNENYKVLTLQEKVKTVWKDYLPAAITGTASTLCIIASVSESCRRSAVLATAYRLSEEAANEYKAKVIETIGEKKEQKIREDIAQDKINNNPVQSTQVILTNQGNALCYDSYSGRYFRFDIDKLKKINNEINARLLTDDAISLNKIYLEYGLDGIDAGYELGWSTEFAKLIDFEMTSKLTKDDEPCLVISFNPAPRPGYSFTYAEDYY